MSLCISKTDGSKYGMVSIGITTELYNHIFLRLSHVQLDLSFGNQKSFVTEKKKKKLKKYQNEKPLINFSVCEKKKTHTQQNYWL